MPLLLLFIVVPALELWLLIELGSRIGAGLTVGLIVITGFLGASLARRQGLGVVRSVQAETAAGRLPAGSLVDGVLILVAGALLITPGILTDITGFLLLCPPVRTVIKRMLRRRFQEAIGRGSVVVVNARGFADAAPGDGADAPSQSVRRSVPGPILDLTAVDPGNGPKNTEGHGQDDGAERYHHRSHVE